MDKKGAEVSITFIVIAAIALVVLVVIVMFFTGAFNRLMGTQSDITVAAAGDQEQEIYKSLCKSYCTLGSSGYCDHIFEYKYQKDDKTDGYYCYKCGPNSDPDDTKGICNGMINSLGVLCTNEDVKC
jgi:hypothetical protein